MSKNDQFEIDLLTSYLNDNSKKIFNEIILAKKYKMWATVIVFSLAILDNLFHQEDNSYMVDGLELNSIKYSKEITWLRKKRNLLLHYENSLEENSLVYLKDHDLKKDSYKAYNILRKNLLMIYNL